jgi:hypothetical protein
MVFFITTPYLLLPPVRGREPYMIIRLLRAPVIKKPPLPAAEEVFL